MVQSGPRYSVKPPKKRMSWISNLGIHRIHNQYKEILDRVNSGETIIEALKCRGLARSTFYKWKPVAELRILDPLVFQQFQEVYFSDVNLLLAACRTAVSDRRFSSRAMSLKSEGRILDQ